MSEEQHDNPETTRRYESEDDPAATRRYTSDNRSAGATTYNHGISPGQTIELNGKSYTIQDVISALNETGEAAVYAAEDEQGHTLALKLYYHFRDPRDEPNPEALARIGKIKDPDILPLIDAGTGDNKYRGEFCFEIAPLAVGGDLLYGGEKKHSKIYSTRFVSTQVVPQIFHGLTTLHRNKIVHGDLKPHNIFYLDKKHQNLVIGDYGSSKTFEQASQRNLSFTSMAKGTGFYLPPEQARGVISDKNDYYSFGMTLLHLLYPQLVNRENLARIVERQFSKKPIIDYNPKFGRLNDLIAGLTLQDIERRWGRDQVAAWIAGETPVIRYESITPLKPGSTEIYSGDDLIAFIENDPEWYDLLIEDREGYSMLLGWVSRLEDLKRKQAFDSMIMYFQSDGPEFVRTAISGYFQPLRPTEIDGEQFDFVGGGDIGEKTGDFIDLLDRVYQQGAEDEKTFGGIAVYLMQLEWTLRTLHKAATGKYKIKIALLLQTMMGALNVTAKKAPDDYRTTGQRFVNPASLLQLFYALNLKRGFRDHDGNELFEIHDIALYFAANQAMYHRQRIALERIAFLKRNKLQSLVELDFPAFLFTVFKDQLQADINLVSVAHDRGEYAVNYTLRQSLRHFFEEQRIDPDNALVMDGLPITNASLAEPQDKITEQEPEPPPQRQSRRQRRRSRKKGAAVQTDNVLTILLPVASDSDIVQYFWQAFFKQHAFANNAVSSATRLDFEKSLLPRIQSHRAMVIAGARRVRFNRLRTAIKPFLLLPAALLPLVVGMSLSLGLLLSGSDFQGQTLDKMKALPGVELIERHYQKLQALDNRPILQEPRIILQRSLLTTPIPIFYLLLYLLCSLPQLLLFYLLESEPLFRKQFMFHNLIPLGYGGWVVSTFYIFPVIVLGLASFPRLHLYAHLPVFIALATIMAANHFYAIFGINRRIHSSYLITVRTAGLRLPGLASRKIKSSQRQ